MSDYANLREQLYLALQYIDELEAQLPGAQTRPAGLPPAKEPQPTEQA
jgi:hypothetical protein